MASEGALVWGKSKTKTKVKIFTAGDTEFTEERLEDTEKVGHIPRTLKCAATNATSPRCLYFDGANSSTRMCQETEAPGWTVTTPVSLLPQTFLLYGSDRLNCGSTATKFLSGGAYT